MQPLSFLVSRVVKGQAGKGSAMPSIDAEDLRFDLCFDVPAPSPREFDFLVTATPGSSSRQRFCGVQGDGGTAVASTCVFSSPAEDVDELTTAI